MKKLLVVLFFLGLANAVQAAEPIRKDLVYAPSPVDNPLRGFVPFQGNYGNRFPHSMEYLALPLNRLMVGPQSFLFEENLDSALDEIASRGHQAVLRLYLDYPKKQTGVPKYLIDAGLKMTRYAAHGGGLSPDYEDERLYEALETFVTAFGKRYDGDARIGFITIGLIGFWGEWHTYPHVDWFPSTKNQNRVLHAYAKTFRKTKLLMRQPMADGPKLPIGYHDDSFAFSTLPTKGWHFLSVMKRQNTLDAWKTKSIGGELRPELQADIWKPTSADVQKRYDQCVELTHCSWLINQHVFSYRREGKERDLALQAARELGYELHVSRFELTPSSSGRRLTGDVYVENRGVAPFPYDWPVELRLQSQGKTLADWTTDWKLSELLPGKATKPTWRFEATLKNGLPARFQIELRVKGPLNNAPPLCFANKEQQADGWLRLASGS
ncbi:MAG: DUF4832 domain-containing protein [Planctomycetaceae bacterium]|nr:DUF4832 domain-containing protein [Planctomycetaceae bacterium]